MVDPVTAKIADNVTDRVTEDAGGGFFSDLISAPFRFLKGVVMAPFNGLMGLFKGVFSNTIGNLGGVAMTSGIVLGLEKFAPDLIAALPIKLGGRKIGEIMADHAAGGGMPAIIKDSLIAGVTMNAAIGGAKGALGEAMTGSGAQEGNTAGKIGTGIGTVATLAGLGMLAFAAVNSNKVGFSGNDDATTPKTPDATPATADAAKAKTKA